MAGPIHDIHNLPRLLGNDNADIPNNNQGGLLDAVAAHHNANIPAQNLPIINPPLQVHLAGDEGQVLQEQGEEVPVAPVGMEVEEDQENNEELANDFLPPPVQYIPLGPHIAGPPAPLPVVEDEEAQVGMEIENEDNTQQGGRRVRKSKRKSSKRRKPRHKLTKRRKSQHKLTKRRKPQHKTRRHKISKKHNTRRR